MSSTHQILFQLPILALGRARWTERALTGPADKALDHKCRPTVYSALISAGQLPVRRVQRGFYCLSYSSARRHTIYSRINSESKSMLIGFIGIAIASLTLPFTRIARFRTKPPFCRLGARHISGRLRMSHAISY